MKSQERGSICKIEGEPFVVEKLHGKNYIVFTKKELRALIKHLRRKK
jgi:hypothetical protein